MKGGKYVIDRLSDECEFFFWDCCIIVFIISFYVEILYVYYVGYRFNNVIN